MVTSKRALGLLCFASCAVGCWSPSTPSTARTRSAAAQVYTVTVNHDGSFTPDDLQLEEGDKVVFVGPSVQGTPAELRTTDAIVRVDLADASRAEACITSARAYDQTHMLPGQDNELTGPLRRGASGIFVLGPEVEDGFFEGPAALSCDEIGALAGAPESDKAWEVVTATSSAPTKLCRRIKDSGKPAKTGSSPYVLTSTWDNPDVTGVVVRINWEDLYAITHLDAAPDGDIAVELDFTKLDTELENAAQRGKLVFLHILAGDGIPEWLFLDYPGDVTIGGVPFVDRATPVWTRDFGSSSTTLPNPDSCGYDKRMGSPADDYYKAPLLQTLRDVAEHIRSSAIHYQALASLKVTGLNFLTGEMRLPKRCLDPSLTLADGTQPQALCVCNTEIWAAPLGSQVYANPKFLGGGYTYAKAQNFMNAVENTIYVALGRRKTMHYALIQSGFPKVFDGTNYETFFTPTATNPGFVDEAGDSLTSTQQTIDALNAGQAGDFRKVDSDGVPQPATDPDAHALFSPMHAGLGPIPVDAQNNNACLFPLNMTVYDGKLRGVVTSPGMLGAPGRPSALSDYSGTGSGCPNKWALLEGHEGQLIGYQTGNDIQNSEEVADSLWNATLNTNAVFVELYEDNVFVAAQERDVLGHAVLSESGFSTTADRQKSLGDWATELHDRRRTISEFSEHQGNRHMADPFPAEYRFSFKKDLAPGEVEHIYFVNPGARCQSGTQAYGHIQVTGT